MNPVLKIKSGLKTFPDPVILVDDSSSMLNLTGDKKTRLEKTQQLISEIKKKTGLKFSEFNFSDFNTENQITALSELEKIVIPEKSFTVVLSDFNSAIPLNSDMKNKLLSKGINFHCIDGEPLNYVKISDVFYEKNKSDESFLKLKLKIQVYYPENYTVSLFERNKLISIKDISLTKTGEHEIILDYDTKKNLSSHLFFKFVINISNKNAKTENIIIDNEYNLAVENNIKKNRILCVVNTPDWDFAFFNRLLSKYSSTEISYYHQTLKNINQPISSYSGKYDLIILFKPDFNFLPAQIINMILNKTSGKSTILYFTGTRENNFNTLNSVKQFFKLNTQKNIAIQKNHILKQAVHNGGLFLPIIDWNKYPPFDSMLRLYSPTESIQYISDISDSSPVLFEINNEKTLSLVFTVSGFYKWQFNEGLMSGNSNEIPYFWNSIITYLLNKSIQDDLLIIPSKPLYLYEKFEKAEFEIILSENLKKYSNQLTASHYTDHSKKI
ncbi:hypothetical protein KA977_09705 [Candidatus Dependentiae bacterium]|nr:hypothetical protein [Candidatus Dependentiae bacterium]